MQPFLTIGIASYNYARFLKRGLEAIKRQSFKDFEILYCDDGSTDASVELIQGFITDNPALSIRLVQGKNSGVMGNKNRILDNAAGQYVMLCDADDWMEPNCLELLCGKAKETGADQVIGSFQNVDENGKVLQVQAVPGNPSKWTWGVHHATIYKMDIIREYHLRMDTAAFPDDVYFNMLFHMHSGRTECVTPVVYNWYMHASSTSARRKGVDMWHGYAMLRSILPCVSQAFQSTPDPKEKQEIEYMAIKMYALAIFYRGSPEKFAPFWKEFTACRSAMAAAFPSYLYNTHAKRIDGHGLVRRRTAEILWCESLLERLYLIKPALWGYWLVSKIHPFTI